MRCDELDGRSAILPPLPEQTLYETVGKYLDPCGDGLPRIPPTPEPGPEKDPLSPDNSCGSAELTGTPEVEWIFKLQEEAMKHQ